MTSPFPLASLFTQKIKDDYPDCCEMVNSMYVDDLNNGAKTAQNAYNNFFSDVNIRRCWI